MPDAVRDLYLAINEEEPVEEVDVDWEAVDNETAKLTLKHLYNVITTQLRIGVREVRGTDSYEHQANGIYTGGTTSQAVHPESEAVGRQRLPPTCPGDSSGAERRDKGAWECNRG